MTYPVTSHDESMQIVQRLHDDNDAVARRSRMDAVRARARAEMEAAGTWGIIADTHGAWAKAAAEKFRR